MEVVLRDATDGTLAAGPYWVPVEHPELAAIGAPPLSSVVSLQEVLVCDLRRRAVPSLPTDDGVLKVRVLCPQFLNHLLGIAVPAYNLAPVVALEVCDDHSPAVTTQLGVNGVLLVAFLIQDQVLAPQGRTSFPFPLVVPQ